MEKKTECEIVQDLLLGYSDNVLNPESKKLVEKHLSECEVCRKKLEEIKKDSKDEESEKKQIDYLKKIRIKSRIKSILIAIGVVLCIALILFLRKFIIINNLLNKSEKSLKSNNMYIEKSECSLNSGEASVYRTYYKDGKCKQTFDIYSENGIENIYTKYAEIDSDEQIYINEKEKSVKIEKGNLIDVFNTEKSFKYVPFVQNRSLYLKLGMVFYYGIDTSTYEIGREYYVLRNIVDKSKKYEVWIDKDNGLPLKEFQEDAIRTFFPGTEIVKNTANMDVNFKYSFDTVTDEDVAVPDFTGYTVENIDYNLEDLENK